jgi:hypothetical protein
MILTYLRDLYRKWPSIAGGGPVRALLVGVDDLIYGENRLSVVGEGRLSW